MGAAAAPAAITAGAGLIGGASNNKHQQSMASQANANAQQQIGMQNQLFQTIMGLANKNVGTLNADTQVGNLVKDSTFWNGQQLNGLAGAMRTAGYQPGDSEVNAQLGAANQRNQLQFGQMANQIRVNAPMQQEALYGVAQPGSLNAGIGYNQGQEQMAYSRMSNPGPFIQSISPFLNPNNQYGTGSQTQKVGSGLNLGPIYG